MSSRHTLFQQEVHPGAARTPWTFLSAILLQLSVAAAVLVSPMLWPETLPVVSAAPKVATVLLRAEPPKPAPRPLPVRTSAARLPAPAEPASSGAAVARRTLNFPPAVAKTELPPVLIGSLAGGPLSIGSALRDAAGSGPGVSAGPAATPRPASVRLSSGVTSGLLLAPIRPAYPPIAKVARVEGTIVITATIDREGRVVGAKVVSGPELLRSSALEAVASARYRPYRLNGETTEVLTTISVNFRLSS